jgi:hypothetical protein
VAQNDEDSFERVEGRKEKSSTIVSSGTDFIRADD